MQNLGWKKYAAVFVLTLAVFITALLISNAISDQRVAEMRAIEDNIAINLLSSETQFALLQEEVCAKVNQSMLAHELNELASRLQYAERQNETLSPELTRIKKQYSLLEIKDYLLVKQLNAKCGATVSPVLYFYSNIGDCPACERTGDVLSHVRGEYPAMRVYSFDVNLDLSAVQTLATIYEIDREKLPAVVIDGTVYYGEMDKDAIVSKLPDIVLDSASTTATSTMHMKATSTHQ